jgi:5-methylcytosine-specific restriction endonuclease McrA
MQIKKPDTDLTDIIIEAKRNRDEREKSYRERAMKIFPHVCGRCGREFEGKKLKELTVHHKDHNHDNNPNDGSNWELLCIYCHDNEHSILSGEGDYGSSVQAKEKTVTSTYKAFAGLEKLLKKDT